jgi:hypothetical protein
LAGTLSGMMAGNAGPPLLRDELDVEWAPHPLLYHGGSNGKNLAHIWIDRKKDIAVVTATNISGRKADEALMTLAREVYATK